MKKYTYKFLLFISPLGAGVFLSCNKEEPIPSYIHINAINLSTNYSVEGSSSNKILDAWIYIDDQLVGAFEMPCSVPVLYEGSHEIKIRAGIKENGIVSTRIYYPFYEIFTQTVTLTRGQITTLNPTTTYSSSSDFTWMENFEGAWHSLCKSDSTTDSTMVIAFAPEAFEGAGSGRASITSGAYSVLSCGRYVLPGGGAPVFVEINYNCNTSFNVGMVGFRADNTVEMQEILITLIPTSGWNKVYLNMTDLVSGSPNSTKFAVFFSMLHDTNLSTSYFYLDNVKLVH